MNMRFFNLTLQDSPNQHHLFQVHVGISEDCDNDFQVGWLARTGTMLRVHG